MPANKKYLNTAFHQRLAKITAAILGGYLVTASFFLLLASIWDRAAMLSTMYYGGFMLWTSLMICAFLFRNGWLVWGIYLGISVVFVGIIWFLNFQTL